MSFISIQGIMPSYRRRSSLPRVVVIGAGRMAVDFHLPSLKYLSEKKQCQLTAVCDVNEKAAAAACKKFGVRSCYSDFQEMLRREKPDGVVMIVPISVTAKAGSIILQKGFPLMMEKPAGGSPSECVQLIRAAQKGRTPNMVAFNRRFCPVIVSGKEEALKRGKIKGVSSLMYRNQRTEGVFLKGTGIHSLDAMRYLGGDLVRVETDRRILRGDVASSYVLFMEYANGSVGTMVVKPEAGGQFERYEIFSNKAVVMVHAGVGWLLDTPGKCLVYEGNREIKIRDPLAPYHSFRRDLKTAAVGGFFGENLAFIKALKGEGPFSPSVEESLQSMEIVEAVQAGKRWRKRA